ncbi:uncharacterized protein LOC113331062 [Papaver somniferum]|uniref:uncharacterized protein LOC113331062 n=1 Tax=Papaver somniferum TaxID=3469 RepID=UPI000E7038E6|nr:uncharacterized protein LOC113331062 [Papaver somniferum]
MDSCQKNTCSDDSTSAKLGLNNGNNSSKVPSIELPDDFLDECLDLWKFSLIRRLDLQKIKFIDAYVILRQQWKLKGDCKLIPLGRGFFTIKLDNEFDRQTIKAGQWEVSDQVLQVRKWVSNFRPSDIRTSKAQVWVRFPGLGLELWKEKILFTICKEIGTSIKIDNATAQCEVGYYVNVLIEVDFAQQIPNKIWINTKYGGFFQNVSIPVYPKFCHNCKIIGHLTSECRIEQIKNQSAGKTTPRTAEQTQTASKNQQSHKVRTEFPHTPFDICDRFEVDIPIKSPAPPTHDSIVRSILTPVHPQFSPQISSVGGRFDALNSIVENVAEEEDNAESVILEVPQILKIVESNNLENSTVKLMNDTNGVLSQTPVQVTSWANIVEKEMVINNTPASTSSSDKPKVSTTTTLNNKYNFRKNPGKGGTRNPPSK